MHFLVAQQLYKPTCLFVCTCKGRTHKLNQTKINNYYFVFVSLSITPTLAKPNQTKLLKPIQLGPKQNQNLPNQTFSQINFRITFISVDRHSIVENVGRADGRMVRNTV